MGWLAYAKDTEGNIFGMMQHDPTAKRSKTLEAIDAATNENFGYAQIGQIAIAFLVADRH